LSLSIIGKAREKGLFNLKVHNLRDYSGNKHFQVDDTPYGGGPGMVMKVEPFANAIKSLNINSDKTKTRIILMSPQGTTLTQQKALELSKLENIVILCGHYEGIDERVKELFVDEEISIGDYILTGGELPAMVLIDAVIRLLPNVLGHNESINEESFSDGLLEYPHYTKPRQYMGLKVPEVLLSGNHAQINKWRRQQSLLRTFRQRPDLLEKLTLSQEDRKLLNEALNNEKK
jgi:tRNA (guanine37-N1)-methyltransferase